MPSVFGIADILIVGFDQWGRENDETLEKMLQVCRQANLNRNKCPYRHLGIPASHSLEG